MVDRFGNQLLTSSGFTVYGNRDVGARCLFNKYKDFVNGRTIAFYQVVYLVLSADLFFQVSDFLPELKVFAYVLGDVPHTLLGILVFQYIIVGSLFQQLDGCSHILLTRNDHHRSIRIKLLDLLQHLESGHIRKVIIQRYKRGIFIEVFQQGFPVGEDLHLVVGIERQMVRNNLRKNDIILNDKYSERIVGH